MSTFDVKFAAYQGAMHQNNNFGLTGEAVSEQYGRYTIGLQYAEEKAEKKKLGRALAKEKATQKKAAQQSQQPKQEKQSNTKQTNSEAVVELNQKQAKIDKQNKIAALQKKSQKIEQKITEKKRQLGKTTNKNQKQNLRSQIDRLNSEKQSLSNEINSLRQDIKASSKSAKAGVQEAADAVKSPVANGRELSASMQKKLSDYRQAMEKQGLTGDKLDKQVENYKEGLIQKARKNRNKLQGQQKAREIAKSKLQNVSLPGSTSAEAAEAVGSGLQKAEAGLTKTKPKTGFFKSIKNAFKGKKGKAALAAAAIATVVAVVGVEYKSYKSKNEEDAAASLDESAIIPVVENDTETEETVTEPDESPDENPEEPSVDVNNSEYAVQPGDSFWNIAKENLKDQHKDVEGYKPSNKEILEEMNRLLEKNNYKLDANKYYPEPMLFAGDKLNIAA